MKFNIKSAVKYSSALKTVTVEVENSLRVNSTLINRYGENEVNSVPAVNNGLYTATITHQKSKVSNEVGKQLEDEKIDVKANEDFTQLSPETRLQILSDLLKERTAIDTQIENIKNSSTITDEFTGKELTYDLGCQINNMYREYEKTVLRPLVDMNSKLETTVNGKVTVTTSGEDKSSITATYPIVIEATANVKSSDILKQYDEVHNKCSLNSDKLSAIEISKYFEYEPQFNLNPSIRSLIEQYSNK
jgi:hypothetical protein